MKNPRRTLPPITSAIILISTVVWLLFEGHYTNLIAPLFFSSASTTSPTEITHGQVWRLVTPIFLHFHFLHILFNGLAFLQIGVVLERFLKPLQYLGVIIGFAIISNVAQFLFVDARFGGLSGVLFGMLSFMWIYGLFYPKSQLYIPPLQAGFVFIFYLLCWTNLFFPIANIAHTAGLLSGLISGLGLALYRRRKPIVIA